MSVCCCYSCCCKHSQFYLTLFIENCALDSVSFEKITKNLVTDKFFKGGPSHLWTKILQSTKKLSLFSQNLLIFIHKTPVVENQIIQTTGKFRDLLRPRST